MTMTEINAALEAMTRFARIWLRQSAKDGSVSASDIISCKALLPVWKENISVDEGDYYTYSDSVYCATSSHISSNPPNLDTENWELVYSNPDPEFNSKSSIDSVKKLLEVKSQALSDQDDFLEECIVEMAMVIYAE